MKDKYKAVCQQLLPAANYKNYRALIAKAEPPCVPYIGTYLTDLTFIDEGNPDYITEGDAKLINYKKFQMISELIQRIQRFQRTGYTFTLDNELKKYLLTSFVCLHPLLSSLYLHCPSSLPSPLTPHPSSPHSHPSPLSPLPLSHSRQVTMDDNTAYKLSLKVDPKML